MTVHSWRELPREASHKFGESPKFKRTFALTLQDPDTSAVEMITAIGVSHGDGHPELADALCINLTATEGYEESRYHALVVAEYEVPQFETATNPTARPDVWSFSSSGVATPAFFYFDGTDMKPLVNAAGDFFEGLTADEAQQKLTIKGNRATFPSATARALTNCVNSGTFLGAPAHSWKCMGINAESKAEVVGNTTVNYWEVSVELVYRQTGWNLQIPNVGFNYIQGSIKRRAYVLDPDDGSRLPCTNPVGLNTDGSLITDITPPPILTRRVYKEVDFSTYFGSPPP